jgi:hypothetical protein
MRARGSKDRYDPFQPSCPNLSGGFDLCSDFRGVFVSTERLVRAVSSLAPCEVVEDNIECPSDAFKPVARPAKEASALHRDKHSNERTAKQSKQLVSLPEIKSERIDGANLRGADWTRCGQRPEQHATLVHPCSAIGAYERHCNIFGTIEAAGEGAAR